MVATAATASIFSLTPSVPESNSKNSGKLRGGSLSFKSNPNLCNNLRVNAQAPHKINGTSVGLTSPGERTRDEYSSHQQPRTFINQLPDWSMLLAAITTIFLAAEKQWMMLDWKPKRPDMLIDPFGLGRIVQDGLIFSQNFSIRSYEIGADRTASIETLMNHLQVLRN